MSVKNFKFVSPGVFINEIDNSFIPKSAEEIGPVVIGRASRGPAMQPVKVSSYSEFVEVFGDTVPGGSGGDVYRDGNYQSAMYGTYAAKAFLRANVAPLTYVRLLGEQNANNTGASTALAGWKTNESPGSTYAGNGGAYGLWIWPSSSSGDFIGGVAGLQGVLAAIWYVDDNATIALSGTLLGSSLLTAGTIGKVVANDTDTANSFTVEIRNNDIVSEKIRFNLDDSSDLFIRKRFNTNPQLVSAAGTFAPASSKKNYWLGESFEQEIRDGIHSNPALFTVTSGSSLASAALHGCMLPIALSSSNTTGPHNVQGVSADSALGKAGWFIGQDLGTPASFRADQMQQLFRLKDRGHGEWLQKNVKVSIENIRKSTSTVSGYGTFSVVLRALSDTDSNVQVVERFDNCTLDPTSPNFLSRKLGDKYVSWDTTSRRLKTYGEYANQSKFVYVEMNATVEAGGTDAELLPFGYYGPPRFSSVMNQTAATTLPDKMIFNPGQVLSGSKMFSGSTGTLTNAIYTGSLGFPVARIRLSASDGGLPSNTDAYFGFQTTRSPSSTRFDPSVASMHRFWTATSVDDPVNSTAVSGIESYAYIFTLDNVRSGSAGGYYYESGSRASSNSLTSASYGDVLDLGFGQFTAPIWGGFNGWDITKPDPLYNTGMSDISNVTDRNSYAYNTIKRAIDTVADPESLNMNLLSAPGVTVAGLTTHMVNVCEERADAMSLIDLPNVYLPASEGSYSSRSTKASRIATTPQQAATALRDRRIDSSYGATFYPWVQTVDDRTGRMLWIPPSVAMMGVLASSQAASELWFAPAGFNRGGLSDGAAGIPVTSVTERLTSKERDTLYDARINPIASFPSSGIVVFGQKTLQERQSALDRINVRRLVIYLKKQISILSTQILFEQNVQATWARFKGLVEPFLQNAVVRLGLTEYRLVLDESTTTPDLIDQNIMYAKIMVKPARSIEFIAIDFVVASTGASFDD
mgnify:FL=1